MTSKPSVLLSLINCACSNRRPTVLTKQFGRYICLQAGGDFSERPHPPPSVSSFSSTALTVPVLQILSSPLSFSASLQLHLPPALPTSVYPSSQNSNCSIKRRHRPKQKTQNRRSDVPLHCSTSEQTLSKYSGIKEEELKWPQLRISPKAIWPVVFKTKMKQWSRGEMKKVNVLWVCLDKWSL